MEGSKKAVSVIRQTDTDRWCCESIAMFLVVPFCHEMLAGWLLNCH